MKVVIRQGETSGRAAFRLAERLAQSLKTAGGIIEAEAYRA